MKIGDFIYGTLVSMAFSTLPTGRIQAMTENFYLLLAPRRLSF